MRTSFVTGKPTNKGRRRPGAAMVEFVILLPIIILIIGLSMYLAMGLAAKENLVVQTRYLAWNHSQGDTNDPGTWPSFDPNATGAAGSGTSNEDPNHPRGTGDALNYALANAGQQAESSISNNSAQDLFNRVWNNLPGRNDAIKNDDFEKAPPAFKYLNGNIYAELQLDTADWVHGQNAYYVFDPSQTFQVQPGDSRQLPRGALAQYGPMQQINTIFSQTFGSNLPQPFQRMGQEVLHGWFTESYMWGWNNTNAKIP